MRPLGHDARQPASLATPRNVVFGYHPGHAPDLEIVYDEPAEHCACHIKHMNSIYNIELQVIVSAQTQTSAVTSRPNKKVEPDTTGMSY